jgi:hypothetical protein
VQARRHHLHLLHRAPAHGAPRVMAHRPELHRCGSARRAMANAIWTAGRRARRRDDRDVFFSGRGSGLRRDRLEISKETSIGRDGRFAFKCLVSHVYNCSLSVIHHDRDDHHKRTLLMSSFIITRVSSSARAARASRPPSG